MRARLDLFESILDASADGLIFIDRDGFITYVYQSFEKIHGVKAGGTRIFAPTAGCFVKSRGIMPNDCFSGTRDRPNVRLSGVVCPAKVRLRGCDSSRQIPGIVANN
jgi:hypothetical protein